MRHLLLIPFLLFLLAACGRVPALTPTPGFRGTEVVLAAEATGPVESALMEQTGTVVEMRLNALGLAGGRVTIEGTRLRVELPGVDDPAQAIATLSEQGLLEFIDTGSQPLEEGTLVRTTYPLLESEGAATHYVEPGTSESLTFTQTMTITSTKVIADQVFATVLTGPYFNTAVARMSSAGKLSVAFELSSEGALIFADYTARSVGKYLTIVLDKRVISSPVIQSAIPDGKGEIMGSFTMTEAEKLAILLRYGALPLRLTVEGVRTVP